jgi:hypothetical protein
MRSPARSCAHSPMLSVLTRQTVSAGADAVRIFNQRLVFGQRQEHISTMATGSHTLTGKGQKPGVLGRSAATGRFVMAPVVSKKSTVSDKRITAAVKSVHDKKK